MQKKKNPVEQIIQEKVKELQHLQMSEPLDQLEAKSNVQEELHCLIEQEDMKWRQWAKANWLQHRDRNTKYFHACATQRKHRANNQKIQNMEGIECKAHEQIEVAFVSYYSELFRAGREEDMEDCLGAQDRKVTEEMNQKLLVDLTVEEIYAAMHDMQPIKAPGPDDFSVCFYQLNWVTVHP